MINIIKKKHEKRKKKDKERTFSTPTTPPPPPPKKKVSVTVLKEGESKCEIEETNFRVELIFT